MEPPAILSSSFFAPAILTSAIFILAILASAILSSTFLTPTILTPTCQPHSANDGAWHRTPATGLWGE